MNLIRIFGEQISYSPTWGGGGGGGGGLGGFHPITLEVDNG